MTGSGTGTLLGKTVLITGAARGQGRAHALAAAREGANIVAVDVAGPIDEVAYPLATADDLQEVADSIERAHRRVLTAAADVRDSAALDALVARALDEFGAIDGVVANAAVLDWDCRFWEIPDERWNVVLDVNLTGVWRTLKAVVPAMIEAGEGSLVVVASINSFEPAFDYSSYVVAKHGLLGLVRNAALELAEHNVLQRSLPRRDRHPYLEQRDGVRQVHPPTVRTTGQAPSRARTRSRHSRAARRSRRTRSAARSAGCCPTVPSTSRALHCPSTGGTCCGRAGTRHQSGRVISPTGTDRRWTSHAESPLHVDDVLLRVPQRGLCRRRRGETPAAT